MPHLLLCGVAASTLALGVPAAAQDSLKEQSVSPANIIVTAKSRNERLQDVPLAISAFTSDDLRQAQVTGLQDLQKITPNLNLFAGAGRNDPTGYGMRGLTPNTSDERYQGISFFLDGIALSGQLASLDLNTVERVEVIKGPQSATFGRATYSGAINFITKEPSGDDITGSVRARGALNKGGEEASWLFSGSVSAPIIKDRLWLNIGATAFQNGAVARALDDGSPVGRERTQVVTGTLFFRPDDSFSINLRGLYSHDRDFATLKTNQHPRDWVEAGVPLVPLPRGGGAFFPSTLLDTDVNAIGNAGASGTDRDRYFASLIVKKQLGDYELNYSGGYLYTRQYREEAIVARSIVPGTDPVFGDLIGTGALAPTGFGGTFAATGETFENNSHQIMLLSPSADRFRWRAGLYYFNEIDITTFPLSATVLNPTGRSRKDILTNYAAFGGFDFKLTDQLTLSGEGRIAREKLTYADCPNCTNPIAQGQTNSSTDFTPRITISYQPTNDHLLYALYSKGVKSARQSRVIAGGVPAIFVAAPEELSNFEIGSKNTLFGGRLTLNGAGFYQLVRNQQLVSFTNFLVNGNALAITAADNVGKSKVWGFEMEALAAVTPSLTLRGSVGYAKHEFTSDTPIILSEGSVWGFPGVRGGPVVLKGKTQANMPRWNGFVSAEYTIPDLVGSYDLAMRIDGSYRGKLYADLANLTTIRSFWTSNARISLRDRNVELALFGRNIFNSKRSLGSGLAGATVLCAFRETNTAVYGTSQQCLQGSAQRPAEYGIEASYKF